MWARARLGTKSQSERDWSASVVKWANDKAWVCLCISVCVCAYKAYKWSVFVRVCVYRTCMCVWQKNKNTYESKPLGEGQAHLSGFSHSLTVLLWHDL